MDPETPKKGSSWEIYVVFWGAWLNFYNQPHFKYHGCSSSPFLHQNQVNLCQKILKSLNTPYFPQFSWAEGLLGHVNIANTSGLGGNKGKKHRKGTETCNFQALWDKLGRGEPAEALQLAAF